MTTNFADEDEIGIGHHKGQHLRLKPMTDLLEVQKENLWWDGPHEWAGLIIKGINISSGDKKFVDPVKHDEFRNGKRHFSEFDTDEVYPIGPASNTRSLDTMPRNNESGFAFLPLGRVESVPNSAWDPVANPRTMIWRDTEYILGVLTKGPRGTHPCHAGEVWMLFDMFEDHEKCRIEDDEHDFGRIKPGDPDVRAGSNIAESFEQLQDRFEWQVEKCFTKSYIVTHAIQYPDEKLGKVAVREDCADSSMDEVESRAAF